MKFNVAALRAAAQEALVADRARWDEAGEKAAERAERSRAEWVGRWGEQWLTAAKVISRKIRKGDAVTYEDLPSDRHYRDLALYTPPSPRVRDYEPPAALTGLIRALDTVADEHVTAAGLRSLGITGSTLSSCIAHMASASVKG